MADIPALSNIPEISFIDNKNVDDIKNELFADFYKKYKELTGETIELSLSNPYRLIMLSVAAQLNQIYQYADLAAKRGLLKYAYGDYLDNLAAFKGVTRNSAEPSVAIVRFSMSDARSEVTPIPAGTRICTADSKYFITSDYAQIEAGQLYVDVLAVATEAGTFCNNIAIGQINIIVDISNVPYVESVSNITESYSGSDVETDEELTFRVYSAPAAFSSAGSAAAYEYFAKEHRPDIEDVKAISPSAGKVAIYFSLNGGKVPTDSDVSDMQVYFNTVDRIPLTDNIEVKKPSIINYNIDFTYYIKTTDINQKAVIQKAVSTAVDNYIEWQEKLNCNVNPSELIKRIMLAGAERVVLTAPAFMVVDETHIPKCSEKNYAAG